MCEVVTNGFYVLRVSTIGTTEIMGLCARAQVVKEVLRYRPPAPMVPQIVQKPFRLSDDYVAPKGALIMPSIVASCMQVQPTAKHTALQT